MAELMQPNIVGNFLNAYQSGLERQEAQKEAERQRMRQDRSDQRSDQQFQWQMDDRQLQEAMRRKETLARAAMALDTPEKWTAGAPQVMRELGMDGEVPGFDQRDRIISESMTIGDQLEQQWKERGYKLDEMRTMAQVRASNANAAQSYAQADAALRGNGRPKPMPGPQQSKENAMLEQVQVASNNAADVTAYIKKIDAGQFDPGLLKNKYEQAKSFFGAVDPNDANAINYNNFISDMNRLRNESLRLNTGPQTDADAQRAWDELFDNINDKTIVKARLEKIAEFNKRAARQKAALIQNQRRNYFGPEADAPEWESFGIDPTIFSKPVPAAPKPAAGGAPASTTPPPPPGARVLP
jgi:hypothetical protein